MHSSPHPSVLRLLGNIAATQGPSRFPRFSRSQRRFAHLRDYDEAGSKREARSTSLDCRAGARSFGLPPPSSPPALFFPAFRHFFISRRTPPTLPLAPEREVAKCNITLCRPLTANRIRSCPRLGRRLTIVIFICKVDSGYMSDSLLECLG